MSETESPYPLLRARRKRKYRKKRRSDFEPITSYGLIAYAWRRGQLYFLLYQRRDNFEYMDFLRGVWSTQEVLPSLFSAMSQDERDRIRNFTFQELWEDLWVEHESRIFLDGLQKAKRKYEMVRNHIPYLLNTTASHIREPPWGFPKGKKNSVRESSISCALREFREETQLSVEDTQINRDISPYIETFRGSNGKVYSTHYYVVEFPEMIVPPRIPTPHCIRDETVSEEASDVQWFSYEEACSLLNDVRREFLQDIWRQMVLAK